MNNAEQDDGNITAETMIHFQPEIARHGSVGQAANTYLSKVVLVLVWLI